MRTLLLALALLASPGAAAAGGQPEPAPASSAATTADAADGAWELSVSRPGADGSRAILARLRAVTPIASGFDEVTPMLVLRYHRGQTSAFIDFDAFLGSGSVDAEVRFGTEAAVKQTWALSSDGRSAFVPGDGLAFVRQLEQVTSFSVRVTPRGRSPFTVVFRPHDTAAVVKALLAAGVKYGG